MTTLTELPTATSVRTRLLVATAALMAIQIVHLLDVLRYAEDAPFPGVLADPLAAIGIGLAGVAFVMLATNRPPAGSWVISASGAVAVGFLLHHGIPFDLGGTNNPYYTFADGNRADWFRWMTVVVLIGLGAWTAATAWRANLMAGERAARR